MREFRQYVDNLERTLSYLVQTENSFARLSEIDAALESQPTDELRRVVAHDRIRSTGAFFTDTKLANDALRSILPDISCDSVILDPACGAGDLLVACASQLTTGPNLSATLSIWGNNLLGCDIDTEFVRTTKIRLVMAAIRRGIPIDSGSFVKIGETFPKIVNRSGLSNIEAFEAATHIVINPPFTLSDAPKDCNWASGRVNSAALFVEACLRHAKPGTRIAAILPDVLRSGSRYVRWRNMVESESKILGVHVGGQFANWADVHVFTLELEVREPSEPTSLSDWGRAASTSTMCVGDYFTVGVGPVVDYRDPVRGPLRRYIVPRSLPPWKTVNRVRLKRRFGGRVVTPPFVAVRRTSRPGDEHRAVGSIVVGKKPVAVENHFIVLVPKSGTITACRKLLCMLKESETDIWLDKYIRCRHLTVSSLADLPWMDDVNE